MDPITQQPQQSQQSPVQSNSTPTSTPTYTHPEKKKVGPIIAILIVVLVLVIGALYLFASRINQQIPADNNVAGSDAVSTQPETVTPITSKSDDVSSIESDLNTSINGLDNQNF